MKSGSRMLGAALLAVAVAACQTAAPSEAEVSARQTWGSDGHGLAQAACSRCHSIEQFGISANPMAPEFPTIANRPGLTLSTLTNWLRNAHNYPDEMNFTLGDHEIGLLVSYIMTLQDPAYEPPIQ